MLRKQWIFCSGSGKSNTIYYAGIRQYMNTYLSYETLTPDLKVLYQGGQYSCRHSYRWGDWGMEKWNDLPQVSCGRTGE